MPTTVHGQEPQPSRPHLTPQSVNRGFHEPLVERSDYRLSERDVKHSTGTARWSCLHPAAAHPASRCILGLWATERSVRTPSGARGLGISERARNPAPRLSPIESIERDARAPGIRAPAFVRLPGHCEPCLVARQSPAAIQPAAVPPGRELGSSAARSAARRPRRRWRWR